jgi:hypothetical protein
VAAVHSGFPGVTGGVAGGGNFYTGPNLEVPPDFDLNAQGDLATVTFDQSAYDRLITDANMEMLERRIRRRGKCSRILGGVSADDFWNAVKDMKIYDGRPTSPGSGRSQNDIVGNGVGVSLATTVQSNIAVTLQDNQGRYIGAVILGRDYYGDPNRSQPDTLLHEALHFALGMGDEALERYLAQFGFKNTDPYSTHDITRWLERDCPDERR